MTPEATPNTIYRGEAPNKRAQKPNINPERCSSSVYCIKSSGPSESAGESAIQSLF